MKLQGDKDVHAALAGLVGRMWLSVAKNGEVALRVFVRPQGTVCNRTSRTYLDGVLVAVLGAVA